MNIIKKSLAALISFVVASTACELQAAVPAQVMTQSITEPPSSVTAQSVYPNIHGKSLTTPVAWGAGYGDIFLALVPYHVLSIFMGRPSVIRLEMELFLQDLG